MLLAALTATKDSAPRVREASHALLRALAGRHPRQFGPVLDVVVQPLLQGCADPSPEVGPPSQIPRDCARACAPSCLGAAAAALTRAAARAVRPQGAWCRQPQAALTPDPGPPHRC